LGVQPLRDKDREPLHAAREPLLVGRLANELQVVALDREVDEPKSSLRTARDERATDRAETNPASKVGRLGPHLERDVHRESRGARRPRPMTDMLPGLLRRPSSAPAEARTPRAKPRPPPPELSGGERRALTRRGPSAPYYLTILLHLLAEHFDPFVIRHLI